MKSNQLPARVRRLDSLRRCVVPASIAVALLATTAVLFGADKSDGGASPYVTTCGEWLCLSLNVEEAQATIHKSPVGVYYAYDPSKPDTIAIQVRYPPGLVAPEAVRNRAELARKRAIAAAALRGWDLWLQLDVQASEE
ncbi:MAG: hypothetical protein JXB62_09945 [Pirellulales bacterium]|nr:hypothetical protein [Pirellulales bacterium]